MRYLSFFILILLIWSCQDVIDVDLDDDEPRLIVDALIRIDTSLQLTEANIKVSLSSSFFGEIEPAIIESMEMQNPVSGDSVVYEPVPEQPGIYRPSLATGPPVFNDNRILTSWLTNPEETINLLVQYDNQSYLARATFVPSVPIDSLEQGDGELFSDDTTEVEITYTDIEDRDDFYVIDFDFNQFIASEDRFYAGQQFSFSYFYSEQLEVGQEVNISILGADEPFFDYMNGLIEQSQQGENGPFQTPTATVRGNFLNITETDNTDILDNTDRPDAFILGYFSLSEEHTSSIVIE